MKIRLKHIHTQRIETKNKMKKIVVFTGAGVSVESGVPAFRYGEDALWAGVPVGDVATPAGWKKDRENVLDFYNQRRKQLLDVEPNDAHKALAKLEGKYSVTVVTQNVDDLHERGGSSNVLHLHGELTKARGCMYDHKTSPFDKEVEIGYNDINVGDKCEETGSQLRPHIVWFGEMPFHTDEALSAIQEADIVMIIGTSLQIGYTIPMLGVGAQNASEIYYIDPEPARYLDAYGIPVVYIEDGATKGVGELVDILMAREYA